MVLPPPLILKKQVILTEAQLILVREAIEVQIDCAQQALKQENDPTDEQDIMGQLIEFNELKTYLETI